MNEDKIRELLDAIKSSQAQNRTVIDQLAAVRMAVEYLLQEHERATTLRGRSRS